MSELSKRAESDNQPIVVAALYLFVKIVDCAGLQDRLLGLLKRLGIRGTILVAPEGINGTVSGTRETVDAMLANLRADPGFAMLSHKESLCDAHPFYRTKVKLKKEIVTMGVEAVDPNAIVGTYVSPRAWNALLEDPDVLVIDTRNDYEVEIGTFKGAVNPETTSFRQFPAYVEQTLDPGQHKKVAMFCTGGIRCEKSTAYLKQQGFENVYHLQGGILNYLASVPEDESLWQGECFVFDNRVAVNQNLEPGSYDQCFACRHPVDADAKASSAYVPGVSCPRCASDQAESTRLRAQERQRQMELAKERGLHHIGDLANSHLRD